MLKENVSLFSSKISLRSLHMCETIIIHSIRDNERERDTLCLASSFEREEGIILSRFLLRVKKEATTTTTTTAATTSSKSNSLKQKNVTSFFGVAREDSDVENLPTARGVREGTTALALVDPIKRGRRRR